MNQRSLTVTQSLLIINVLVFVLGLFVQAPLDRELAMRWGGGDGSGVSVFKLFWNYSFEGCFQEGEFWRVVTYQFVHSNTMHLIFNMWALFFFGPIVERLMGGKWYLAYYLGCGVAGALFFSLLAALGFFGPGWMDTPLIGASAAIYGVMVAVAFIAPDARVQLVFPPVSMTMRTFALVVIAIACSTIVFQWDNAGGEAGHLGGIIMGAIVMTVWKLVIRHRMNQWNNRL